MDTPPMPPQFPPPPPPQPPATHLAGAFPSEGETTAVTGPKSNRHLLRNSLVVGGTFIAGLLIGTQIGPDAGEQAAEASATTVAVTSTASTPLPSEVTNPSVVETTPPTTAAPECQPGETSGVGSSRQSCADGRWIADPEATTTTAAPVVPVAPADMSIQMFITENKCFNSAGALITAEPNLAYLGTADLTGREFLIVYDVTGGGAFQTGNVELHADGQYSYDSEIYRTDTCVAALEATVTAVLER